jgi:hypothetical protein
MFTVTGTRVEWSLFLFSKFIYVYICSEIHCLKSKSILELLINVFFYLLRKFLFYFQLHLFGRHRDNKIKIKFNYFVFKGKKKMNLKTVVWKYFQNISFYDYFL